MSGLWGYRMQASLCTELGVLYDCRRKMRLPWRALVAAILLYSHSVLSSISICFQWFTFFAFLLELFGNEGELAWRMEKLSCLGVFPNPPELQTQESLKFV